MRCRMESAFAEEEVEEAKIAANHRASPAVAGPLILKHVSVIAAPAGTSAWAAIVAMTDTTGATELCVARRDSTTRATGCAVQRAKQQEMERALAVTLTPNCQSVTILRAPSAVM